MTALLAAFTLAQAVASPDAGASAVPTDAVASASPDDAVISDSGSTNAAGYRLVIHRDGTADVFQNGRATRRLLAHPQTAWLFAKLDEDAPLDAVETGHCMRSMSFGTVTRIAYHGQTTGDVQCSVSPAAAELKRTVRTIVAQLGIATRPFRRFAL